MAPVSCANLLITVKMAWACIDPSATGQRETYELKWLVNKCAHLTEVTFQSESAIVTIMSDQVS